MLERIISYQILTELFQPSTLSASCITVFRDEISSSVEMINLVLLYYCIGSKDEAIKWFWPAGDGDWWMISSIPGERRGNLIRWVISDTCSSVSRGSWYALPGLYSGQMLLMTLSELQNNNIKQSPAPLQSDNDDILAVNSVHWQIFIIKYQWIDLSAKSGLTRISNLADLVWLLKGGAEKLKTPIILTGSKISLIFRTQHF